MRRYRSDMSRSWGSLSGIFRLKRPGSGQQQVCRLALAMLNRWGRLKGQGWRHRYTALRQSRQPFCTYTWPGKVSDWAMHEYNLFVCLLVFRWILHILSTSFILGNKECWHFSGALQKLSGTVDLIRQQGLSVLGVSVSVVIPKSSLYLQGYFSFYEYCAYIQQPLHLMHPFGLLFTQSHNGWWFLLLMPNCFSYIIYRHL